MYEYRQVIGEIEALIEELRENIEAECFYFAGEDCEKLSRLIVKARELYDEQ